jgi:small conductance mechanosensitive channel
VEEQLDRVTNYVVANYHDWLIVPVIGLAGYFVIRTTDKYVARFFDRAEYDRTLEILFQKTIKVFLWSVVLILALANIGFDVTGFVAGLGVMGFIVGFAVKDVLSNLAAGMFLLVKRPFKVGETVNVAGVQGKVEEMTLSSCLIITEEQQHVTVPNTKIWGNAIRNLSRGASEQRCL